MSEVFVHRKLIYWIEIDIICILFENIRVWFVYSIFGTKLIGTFSVMCQKCGTRHSPIRSGIAYVTRWSGGRTSRFSFIRCRGDVLINDPVVTVPACSTGSHARDQRSAEQSLRNSFQQPLPRQPRTQRGTQESRPVGLSSCQLQSGH